MKTMTVSEAVKLVKAKPAPTVSIYLSTDVPEKDGANILRLNLQRLYKSAEAIFSRSYGAEAKDRLLQPLKKALSIVGLRRSKGGIGIYHNEHFTGIVNLPTLSSDLAVAADSFHIKPVLRCVQSRRSYFLLALRKKHADLFMVTADGTNLLDSIPINLVSERQSQTERGNKSSLMDRMKIRRRKDLKLCMEHVHRQLESNWRGEKIPLMLIGSHNYQEAFREVCSYLSLLDIGVSQIIEDKDDEAIANLSLKTMEYYFEEMDNRLLVNFRKAQAAGLATTDLEEIAKAAARGQIQNLFVAEDRQVWGHIDRDTGDIRIIEKQDQTIGDDLLDDVAELTLNKGGAVTVLPIIRMPDNHLIAAVLRWSESSVTMPTTNANVPYSWSNNHRYRGELRA